MATMCVINGDTTGQGLVFALCHDFRVIESSATVQFKDNSMLTPMAIKICRSVVEIQATRNLLLGSKLNAQ